MTISPELYAKFVSRGTFWPDDDRERKILAGMGLAGEAAEVAAICLNRDAGKVTDRLKKNTMHGDYLDLDELAKEMGDVLWYLQLLMNVTGFTMEEVMRRNIVKLCDRYPQHYGDPEQWGLEEEGENREIIDNPTHKMEKPIPREKGLQYYSGPPNERIAKLEDDRRLDDIDLRRWLSDHTDKG